MQATENGLSRLEFLQRAERLQARYRSGQLATGPAWLKAAPVLERVENYLRSGIRFVYLQALLQPSST